jgi:16S rRNA (guanine(966)-N(2))-methyltransferase RsmD
MMHIITGSARGVKLETLKGEQTRPTSERAKEAIFSMLQFALEGRRVLDLFSGSGQMGLEALSRGAASAVLADKAKDAVAVIAKNAQKTKLLDRAKIVNADAIGYLNRCTEGPFHLVFLDPPYAAGLLPPVLRALLDKKLLTSGATVVAECGAPEALFGGDEALAARFCVEKEKRYGAAYVYFLVPREEVL